MKRIVTILCAILLIGCNASIPVPEFMGGPSKFDREKKACLDSAYLDKTRTDRMRTGEQRRAIYEACMAALEEMEK